MSNRTLDTGLIELLRSLQTRIAKLEGQNNASRRNALRIGNLVVSGNSDVHALSIENLGTGDSIPLGVPKDAEWSYSGTLTVSGNDSDYAPPYTVSRDGVAIEITLSMRVAATSDVEVKLWFSNGKISKSVILPAGTYSTTVGIDVAVSKGDLVYPQIVSDGTDGKNLAVVVRFGLPRGTNTTSED